MKHRDSVRVILEDLNRIQAGHHRPSAIKLKRHPLRIGQPQQLCVWRLSLGHGKLGSVVVIPKADSSGCCLVAKAIELLGVVMPVIERKGPSPARRSRRRWIPESRARANDKTHPKLLVILDDLIKPSIQVCKRTVRADAAQARLVE